MYGNEFHGPEAEKNNLRGPAYAINNIEEMDKQAERVQGAVSFMIFIVPLY
jgi:hypothetical protein